MSCPLLRHCRRPGSSFRPAAIRPSISSPAIIANNRRTAGAVRVGVAGKRHPAVGRCRSGEVAPAARAAARHDGTAGHRMRNAATTRHRSPTCRRRHCRRRRAGLRRPGGAGTLFTLINQLPAGGGRWLATAASPPASLALRDDLRTRVALGLVFSGAAGRQGQIGRARRLCDGADSAIGRRDRLSARPRAPRHADARRHARARPAFAGHAAMPLPMLRGWLQRDAVRLTAATMSPRNDAPFCKPLNR